LEGINAQSRNGLADQLFLSLGHALTGEGSRAGGARAVESALERLGLPRTSLHQVDGSGLSREDRVSARALCALLERVLGAEPETARLYRDSLAVMGRKGTLEGRLRGTVAEGRVFAKTGWIAGVSTLSGYAAPEEGEALVFSILIEYPSELAGLNTSCFKPLQDELVLRLFREGA
jgi:D-alanyl-D-alanine carboxypeptidase/D-alanyl-D-alanine-endopeptidase (penicillin-binding protein 4)